MTTMTNDNKPTTRWADETTEMSPDFKPLTPPPTLSSSSIKPLSLDNNMKPTGNRRTPQSDKPVYNNATAPSRLCLFIGSLPFDCTENDIGFFLLDRQCTAISIRMVTEKETRKFRGFAYVDVQSEKDFENGLKVDGAMMKGRRLQVRADEDGKRVGNGSRQPQQGFSSSRGSQVRPIVRDHQQQPSQTEITRQKETSESDKVINFPHSTERPKLVLLPRTKPLSDEQKKLAEKSALEKEEAEKKRKEKEEEELAKQFVKPKARKEARDLNHHNQSQTPSSVVATSAGNAAGRKNRFAGLLEGENDE